jgi:hypothetical protein
VKATDALFERDRYRCGICAAPLQWRGTPRAAFLIPEALLGRYGPEVIYHPLNRLSVCGAECARVASLASEPIACDELAREICEAIRRGREAWEPTGSERFHSR